MTLRNRKILLRTPKCLIDKNRYQPMTINETSNRHDRRIARAIERKSKTRQWLVLESDGTVSVIAADVGKSSNEINETLNLTRH